MPTLDSNQIYDEGLRNTIKSTASNISSWFKSKIDVAIRKTKLNNSQMEQRIKAQRTKYRTATGRHKSTTLDQQKVEMPKTGNLSQESIRADRKTAGRDHLEPNRKATTSSNKPLKLFEGSKAGHTLTKLANNRWLRRGVIGFAAMFAISKVGGVIQSFVPRSAIPDHYDKGYDNIKEHFTDFGSPVNLWKTAAKTITPYKSSMRRGLRTNVRQIIQSNPALDLAANAIKHNQF